MQNFIVGGGGRGSCVTNKISPKLDGRQKTSFLDNFERLPLASRRDILVLHRWPPTHKMPCGLGKTLNPFLYPVPPYHQHILNSLKTRDLLEPDSQNWFSSLLGDVDFAVTSSVSSEERWFCLEKSVDRQTDNAAMFIS